MEKRNPLTVAILIFISFGIYSIYWYWKTKHEMCDLGADIPTTFLMFIPLVNYYWLWKYCKGVEMVTEGKMSLGLAIVLVMLVPIGEAVVQDAFNKV